MKRKVLLCWLMLISSVGIWSEVNPIRFDHYTMDDGLPNNLVDCILQDKRGFMWFGTWNGLSRFDGYSFKNFNALDSTSKGINSNYIFALYQDEQENIWVGTKNGLNIYVYSQEKFVNSKNFKLIHDYLSTPITAISRDGDKTLWIGTQNRLLHIRIVQKSFLSILKTISLPVWIEQVNDIFIDQPKNYWISTAKGLILMNSEGAILSHYRAFDGSGLLNDNIRQVYKDSKHNLWIATEYGLYKYSNGHFTVYINDPHNHRSLIHNSVMNILEVDSSKLLIGTLGGLSIMDIEHPGVFENYTNQLYVETSLNNNFINCLYKDKEGGIWIGTEVGGINRFKKQDNIVEAYEFRFGQQNSLSHNLINAIYDDADYLWIGTAGGGLNRINKHTGVNNVYRYRPNGNNTVFDFISSLYCDSRGRLWIGSWGMGLFRVDNPTAASPKFVNYRPDAYGTGLINDFISSIVEDKNGNLWVGTYEGLDQIEGHSGRIIHVSSLIHSHKISKVGCLAVDTCNRLWVGTREGLYRITEKKKGGGWETHMFSTRDGLSDNYITYLYFDAQGILWIGTYGFGLNQYIQRNGTGKFVVYTTRNGLPNNIIYTICEDKKANLWITTDYGLSCFDKRNQKFRNFYKSDGLLNNKYYWNAAFMSKSGKYFAGGLLGVNAFYPEKFNNSTQEFKVTLTDLKIYNSSVVPEAKYFGKIILDRSISLAPKIVIPYSAKNINIEFSALSYDKPRHLYYAYRLEDFENQWHVVDASKRYAVYTNLPPGKYTFQVRSSAEPDNWKGTITSVNMVVVPPFWKTWWFRIILILLISSIVISIYQYRLNRLKLQKQKLEKLVHQRTIKIEEQKSMLEKQNAEILNQRNKLIQLNEELIKANEFKINFFTNISHEFKTPLTLIIDPLKEMMDYEKFATGIKEKLKIIWYNALRLQYLINQLVEFRKIEQGKIELQVTANDINELIYQIAYAFEQLTKKQQITLNFTPLSENNICWFDAHKVEIILFNLLSNAFKNTPQGGQIQIGLKRKNNNLQIIVADTGIGIEPHFLDKIFEKFYQIKPYSDRQKGGTGLGLSIVKEYIDLHKGSIEVESTVGKGTTFNVTIPVDRESYKDNETLEQQVIRNTNELQHYVTALAYELNMAQPISSPSYPDKPNRATILLVEDHYDLLHFLANNFYRKYNVKLASNGNDAQRLAIEELPDIVISDVMMPGIDGFELCKSLKSNLFTSHIPIILLTAKSSTEDELEGIKKGADIYLPKPFDLEVLMGYVDNLLISRQKLYEAFRYQQEYNTSILASTSLDEQFINRLTTIIEKNIDNPDLSVSELAEALAMSRSSLHKKLTALTGMSPVDFINNYRLKKSIPYLLQGYSISEVAYRVGYADPKYYTRIFKKFFGLTPSTYKIRHSQNNAS